MLMTLERTLVLHRVKITLKMIQLQHVQNTRHHDYQVEVPKYLRMKMFSLVE